MKITTYEYDEALTNKYCEFLKEHYNDDNRIQSHIAQTKKLQDKNHPFYQFGKIQNYLALAEEKVVGHCAAIIDSRNEQTGLIGFYDCINDDEVSKNLLLAAIRWLRENKCNTIEGPINLTIWNDYRFITSHQSQPEIFDPFNKDYYASQWQNNGFTASGQYVSAIRTDFTHVLNPTKKSFENLTREGFNIRSFDTKNKSAELECIRLLANKIFSESWNFVSLSGEEFATMYNPILESIDASFIEIVESPEGEPVGFCFSLPNPKNKEQLIMKTIGVLPEFQGKNIGAALLYSQHLKATNAGFKEFYYPLIRVGNNVTKLPYEGYEIITKYETFKLVNES